MIRYLNSKLQEWDENVKRWYDVPTAFSKSKKKLGDCTLKEIVTICRSQACEGCKFKKDCYDASGTLYARNPSFILFGLKDLNLDREV